MNKKHLKLYHIILLFTLFSITNPALPSLAKELQVPVFSQKNTGALVTTKNELIKVLIKHITELDKNFSIKISYNVLKNNRKSFNNFWEDLAKYPVYNEIMAYTNITKLVSQNYYDYFVWQINANYSISKNKVKKLLKNITPIVKTEEELISAVRKHVENLDKNFYINVDKKVLNINNKKKYNDFWNKLYEIPEFNDISRYFKDFQSTQNTYKSYYKWIIKTGYNINKTELDYMNSFVKSWAEENITSEMTEEEKVRAINDFMVANYRYTFGDKGQCPKGNKNCPEEKLGKYSVYSTFSLLYGGGGVCDAKAKLFYRLAKEAGLDVIYITGFVKQTTLHAWNMVKVDEKWYHLDNTWNRTAKPWMTEYEYFNTRDYYLKSDATMKEREHSWKNGKYPVAKEDYPINEY